MSAADKTKLNGIDEHANAYIHPSHDVWNAASGGTGTLKVGTDDVTGGTIVLRDFEVDAQGHVTNRTETTLELKADMATTSKPGFMSAAEKGKLANIEAEANKYVLPNASSSTLGGIKTTYDSAMDMITKGYTYVVSAPTFQEIWGNNTLNAAIPPASDTAFGAIKVGEGLAQGTHQAYNANTGAFEEQPEPGHYKVATMGAATSSADGTFGAPPSPKAGDQTKFLRGDATWATPSAGVTKVTPGNGLINGTSGTSQAAITSTGTISIKEGGVTNAMLAGSIANGKLSNSKVTIAGNDVSLGGSVTADTLRESLGLSNAMHFVGTTTTAMSDGLTTKNVTINSKTYTPNNGDVVLYSDAEFVWTGSAWERLGRDSSFKTTQTAVTDPSADGTDTAFIDSITQNANGVISPHKASLPTASTSAAGIMKVGTGLSASSGTVSVTYGTAANTACQGNDTRLSHARTPTSHTHGNLTNDGKITTTATIANGDKLVIVDSDTTAASKITGSSITFDGSTTTKALTPKGTWETFVKSQYTLPAATTSALGGIKLSSASDTTPIGSLTVPIGTLASDGLTYAYTPVAGTDISGNNTPLGMIQPDKGFVQETTVVSGVELPRVGVWSVATMGGATSSADGTFGAPPSPKKGDQAKFLRGDATWQSVITAHRTYTAFTGKPAANATPGFGESFTISQIAQSTTGQVSGTDRTVTIPALPTASTSVAGIVKLGTAAGTAAQGNHNHDSAYVAKTAGVTNVAWDSTNKKLTKTINGTSSDVVTAATIKTALSLAKADVGLGNVTNDAQIPKSIGTTKGDIIYWSAASTPARLAAGTSGQVLKMNSSGVPAWAADNNDNNYVSQSGSTTANWRKVLLHYKDDAASTTAVTSSTNVVYSAVGVSVQPSTGTIRTNAYNVADHVTLQYNSTDASLDFVFA